MVTCSPLPTSSSPSHVVSMDAGLKSSARIREYIMDYNSVSTTVISLLSEDGDSVPFFFSVIGALLRLADILTAGGSLTTHIAQYNTAG